MYCCFYYSQRSPLLFKGYFSPQHVLHYPICSPYVVKIQPLLLQIILVFSLSLPLSFFLYQYFWQWRWNKYTLHWQSSVQLSGCQQECRALRTAHLVPKVQVELRDTACPSQTMAVYLLHPPNKTTFSAVFWVSAFHTQSSQWAILPSSLRLPSFNSDQLALGKEIATKGFIVFQPELWISPAGFPAFREEGIPPSPAQSPVSALALEGLTEQLFCKWGVV